MLTFDIHGRFMVVALSNLILLLPLAAVLAIMLSMTGSTVLRPRNDGIRVFVQIIIWQFALWGFVGLFARSTLLSLLWLLFTLAFLVQLWFWERGLARNILLLVIAAGSTSTAQLNKIVHYLNLEGRGYWRRLGKRFGRAWQATDNWPLAMVQMRLVRPARARVALASLASQGDTRHFNDQISQAVQEQKLTSQWLGRLVIVSLSLLLLSLAGILYEWVTGPILESIWKEHSSQNVYELPTSRPWQSFVDSQLHIIVPAIVWVTIMALYVFKKFPMVARRRPMAWLFHNYYRSLVIEGIAHGLKTGQDPTHVCAHMADILAVPHWSRRLRRVSDKLSEGLSLINALANNGILCRHEAATLALCRDSESLAWAMHEISQSLLERTINRTHITVQFVTVGLTLFAAAATSIFAVSTFGALTALMESQA